jgi:penicillin-binding protein 1A
MSRSAVTPTHAKDSADGAEDPRDRLVRGLETAIIGLGVAFVLFAAAGLYLYSLSRSLPDLDVTSASFKTARTSVVYAADGSVLAEWHGEQDRHVVALDDVAKPVPEAVVAIEDARFYEHDGVDWTAVLRAGRVDAGKGAYAQGGSTVTQQLVKLLFTKGDRTLGRKVREALLAYQLETKADKRRVLETYLNVVYFGHGAYGIESAARSYFGKPASELTLPESALLAGLIRAPQKYSPRVNPAAAKARRDVVLTKMREQGYISPAEEQAAQATRVAIVPLKDAPAVAPYFVDYVKQELINRLGADAVYSGGLRVYTTLDRGLQVRAEQVARSVLGAPGDPDVALVTLEPKTGRILAMIGGRDFRRDQFNLAVMGRRQPGSAFKPFVLVTALEKGVSPEQVFAATPISFPVKDGVWKVDNYENAATSPTVSLRAATAWSVNCVYARLIMSIGATDVVTTAHRMGITSPLEANPAIALGGLRYGVSPLEMASAYGTLATGGIRVPPAGVVKVLDPSGAAVFQPKSTSDRVVPAQVAATASDLLHGVVDHGTGTAANTGRWAAGKTGTTSSYRDAWFVGWGDDLATAVWVGYAKSQKPMLNVRGIKVTGGSFPALIWNGLMAQAPTIRGGVSSTAQVSAPGQLKLVRVCADTMLLAGPRCPNVIEMYLPPDQVPATYCTLHR